MLDQQEREARRDMGMLSRAWAKDLARAEKLLEDAGATDEEIDTILGSQFVPSNVDESWAGNALSWGKSDGEPLMIAPRQYSEPGVSIKNLGDVQLYVRSMGKALKITAIFDTDTAANEYMEKHDRAAVIACIGPLVLIADKWDKGTAIPQEETL